MIKMLANFHESDIIIVKKALILSARKEVAYD